jgi:Putative polyhydroxyalkanoic acid system protein (PHA_gran_rgn)
MSMPSYMKPALKRLVRLRRPKCHNRLSSAFHTGLVKPKRCAAKRQASAMPSQAAGLFVFKNQWSGDHLDFRASMLGQTKTGTVDVSGVRLEVQLPWLLSMLANKARALVEKQGKLMLEKPVKPFTTRS